MKIFDFLRKTAKNKKGVSMVEAVIAMSVIAIISFSAVDFINRYSDMNVRMIYRTDARVTAENALECFKYADTPEEFFGALSLCKSGFEKSGNAYNYDDYNFTVSIIAEFMDGGRGVFSVVARDKKNNVIVSIDRYVKGAV